MTQDDLALAIGVNRKVVGQLESGKENVRLEIVLNAARALGLNVGVEAVANPALDVFLNGKLAGTLGRKTNGNLQFRYDKTYIEAGGMPLSLNLPLQTRAFPHRAASLFSATCCPRRTSGPRWR